MSISEKEGCQRGHKQNRIEPIDATAQEIAEAIFAAADNPKGDHAEPGESAQSDSRTQDGE